MPLNSYTYLVFLAIVVIVFWQLPSRWRGYYVLVVSMLYYATWNAYFVAIPLALCTFVYLVNRQMLAGGKPDRRWMWAGIVAVLLVLGFFKYRQFLVDSANALLPALKLHPITFALAIGLPLGISFYSFEAISYLIDSKQGRVGKPRFVDLVNFVTFWPHLMAGPIVRVRELVPQLKFEQGFSGRFLVYGLDRLIWGLVQKNVIANPIGAWVNEGFNSGAIHSTTDCWFLAVGFGLQIYFDFAGYTNMAIGAAQLLGIKLPENFRFPYHASNPADFWSRWHMTLSRWIRDYLFFPVTTKYHGAPAALYISLIGVMAIVGLWHGAGWRFVIWGMMHGLYMVLYRIFEGFKEGKFSWLTQSRISAVGWRAFTLVAVMAAWVPFRAGSLHQALGMLQTMFFSFSRGMELTRRFYLVTVMVSLFCAVEPFLMRWLSSMDGAGERRATSQRMLLVARSLTYACGLLLFMIFDQQDTLFIYFQF